MTKKKNKKTYDVSVVVIIACFALVTLLLYMLISSPNVQYEDLLVTDAVIDNFHVHHHSRTGDTAQLITTDGTEYRIAGNYFPEKETKEKLVEGEQVQIKYYDNHTLLAGLVHTAQEVKIGNKVIVSYENDAVPSAILMILYIILFTVVGVFLLRNYIKQISSAKKKSLTGRKDS